MVSAITPESRPSWTGARKNRVAAQINRIAQAPIAVTDHPRSQSRRPISTRDLFAPVVPADRMHPQYRSLLESKFHCAARALMNEIFERMGDPNGNFVRDFQSHGFHSRVFELACFAYLENAGFAIDRSHEQPDFLISREGIEIAVESVTANPPFSQAADISLLQMPQLSDVAIKAKVATEFPKRMTKILTRKLAHAYH